MRKLSWTGTNNDKTWGPFLFSRSKDRSKGLSLSIESGSYQEEQCGNGAHLIMQAGLNTLMIAIPQFLMPMYREKVVVTYDRERFIEAKGRDWYWNYHPRRFGFSSFEDAVMVYFGRQTHDSRTDKMKYLSIPWKQWRFYRQRFYDSERKLFAEVYETRSRDDSRWEKTLEIREKIGTVDFEFVDFDGMLIVAQTHIEEREWLYGEKPFTWLSRFVKPKIIRYLEIEFTEEVGRRKGSWKGGTLGHSIIIDETETHEEGFRKYCKEYNLTYKGPITEAVQKDVAFVKAIHQMQREERMKQETGPDGVANASC